MDLGPRTLPAPFLGAGGGQREAWFKRNPLARIHRTILDKHLPLPRPAGNFGARAGGCKVSAKADKCPAAQAGMDLSCGEVSRNCFGRCPQVQAEIPGDRQGVAVQSDARPAGNPPPRRRTLRWQCRKAGTFGSHGHADDSVAVPQGVQIRAQCGIDVAVRHPRRLQCLFHQEPEHRADPDARRHPGLKLHQFRVSAESAAGQVHLGHNAADNLFRLGQHPFVCDGERCGQCPDSPAGLPVRSRTVHLKIPMICRGHCCRCPAGRGSCFRSPASAGCCPGCCPNRRRCLNRRTSRSHPAWQSLG
jgi:hypothetical protein